jgi:hypothetical protein
MHDGTLGDNPECSTAFPTDATGGMRKSVPPAVEKRTGVTWAEENFDDSQWTAVDAPHDFILYGDYTEDADSHHGCVCLHVLTECGVSFMYLLIYLFTIGHAVECGVMLWWYLKPGLSFVALGACRSWPLAASVCHVIRPGVHLLVLSPHQTGMHSE